ncbi:MAG: hypothetical protein HPY53_06375 [Brevinematales bacterium]|nr:hypothetical protein [Brevinematales bacterium]
MKYILICYILLTTLTSGYSEATVGDVQILENVKLTKKDGYGYQVIVKNLKLTGLKGKTVMAQFVLHDDQRKLTVYSLEYIVMKDNSYSRDILELEISEAEMLAVFGEGNFPVYAIFQVLRMDTMEQFMSIRKVKEITLNLKSKNPGGESKENLKKWHTGGIKEIESLYGLDILYGDFNAGYKVKETGSYKNLADADKEKLTEKYFPALILALKRYPPEFIKKTGLKGVVFVKEIIFLDQPVGGHFDFSEKLIFITVNLSESWVSHVFAHEFMHYIDNWKYNPNLLQEWKALNAPGTKYSDKSPYNLTDINTFKEHPQEGFLNGYSMNDIYQDRAEIFAAMMTPAEYSDAIKWIENDPYLKKKFDKIKKEMSAIYPAFFDYYNPLTGK